MLINSFVLTTLLKIMSVTQFIDTNRNTIKKCNRPSAIKHVQINEFSDYAV